MMENSGDIIAVLNSPYFTPVFVIGLAVAVALVETFHPANPSQNEDGRRIGANFSLALINMIIALALPMSTSAALILAEKSGFGLLNYFAAPTYISILTTIICATFIGYAMHVAAHRVPVLWRLHKIHHSDRAIDFSTALRHHPVEILPLLCVNMPIMVVLGLHAQTVIILGLIEWIFAVFGHANTRLPQRISKRLAWLIVTPNVHAVHHSAWQTETDSNFGNVVTCWDRLFGTLCEEIATGPSTPTFGLDDVSVQESRQLGALLLLPVRPDASSSTRIASAPEG